MKDDRFLPWKTISRRTILDHSKYLVVENRTVELPEGQIIDNWPWIIIPSAAIVLAVTKDNKFLCFRQTKYAVDGVTFAPVGGMIEPGEDPLDSAKRELLEETGYEAPDWVHLGRYCVDPNRGVADMHLFLALDAEVVSAPESDDLEDQELFCLERTELECALDAGEFKVLAWSAVVALAVRYLDRRSKGIHQDI
jgi:ADP-ribose pyrophosphatase